jgi:phospholipid/cholesterol/gamma-HCH transport system substrate-binding protein
METRANYVVIGLFMLAVVAGVFGFVYWFQNFGGVGARAYYRLSFDGSVSGLGTGSGVLFNGIHVGEVTALSLDPKHPQRVIATVAVAKDVPVRADTQVGLEYAGVTGVASIALKGGSASLPPLAGPRDNPPLLAAAPGSAQDVTQGARDTLRRLDDFIAENQAAFHHSLDNLDKFSGALARNSERLDKIVEGMQNLTGGADGKSGEINEAARSIRKLSQDLDKRTAEIAAGVNQMTGTGTRQLNAIGADARRMIGEVEKAVKNIDKNPSRLIFGGSASTDSDKKK